MSNVNIEESRVPQVLTGCIGPFAIATVFVFARLYSRGIISRNWGWDDSLIFVCWLCAIALTVLQCLQTNYGLGRHQVLQSPDEKARLWELAFAARVLYTIAIGLVKLSMCICYMRVFREVRNRLIVYLITGFIITHTTVLSFLVVFQCTPVNEAWRPGPRHYESCRPILPIMITITAGNIAADIGLIVFVVPNILPLKIPRSQKIALLGLVGLGLIAMTATLGRLIETYHVITSSKDVTWDAYRLSVWSSVDVCTSLFVASAVAIKPFIRKLYPRFLRSYSRRGSSDTGSSSLGTSRKKSCVTNVSSLHARAGEDIYSSNQKIRSWTEHDDIVQLDLEQYPDRRDMESEGGSTWTGDGTFAAVNPTNNRIWSPEPGNGSRSAWPPTSSRYSNSRNKENELVIDKDVGSIRKTISLDRSEQPREIV